MSQTDTADLKPKAAAPAKPAPAAKKPASKPAVADSKTAAPATAAKKAVTRASTKPTKTGASGTTPSVAKDNASAKVKQKLVRDSFTMPRGDFNLINTLKERALTFRRPTKKSELLRAGLHALAALPDAKLKSVLDGLVPLKTGRPKKGE